MRAPVLPHLLETTAFLGPLGIPEMIMILVILVIIALPVVIIVALASKKGSAPSMHSPTAEKQLAELEDLRQKNLITEEEYTEKRRIILARL